jgi:hypothetical protein
MGTILSIAIIIIYLACCAVWYLWYIIDFERHKTDITIGFIVAGCALLPGGVLYLITVVIIEIVCLLKKFFTDKLSTLFKTKLFKL